MELYNHQQKGKNNILKVIKKNNICFLNGETRSGKTLTVLSVANKLGCGKVLFVTKKKAISSIKKDYNLGKFTYKLTVINYESIHKVKDNDFNLVIYDESHSLSAFPKPSKRTKLIKEKFYNIPCIWMTGTAAPESYSQFYHQFWVSKFSPFKKYSNFYRWADKFVNKEIKYLGTHRITDYSNAKVDEIDKIIKPLMVVMKKPKEDYSDINFNKIYVDVPEKIKILADRLIKERAVEGKKGVLMADTPVKLQSKLHQVYNGSCIIDTYDEKQETIILSDYKANFIKEYFKGKKIAIFYYFKAELDILTNVFGENITTDLNEFNNTRKNIALQQRTAEGMNISKADALIYYSLGFSGKDYLQSIDRLTIKGRKSNNVYFVLEKGGMTEKILKVVQSKENYNLKTFKKDYGIK